MFKKLMNVLKQPNLMVQALQLTEQALGKSEQLTRASLRALLDDVDPDFDIYALDREINRAEVEVRRMVFQHLAVNPAGDLTPALILTSTIIDIERIGDYAKNLHEQSERFGRGFPDEPHHARVRGIANEVLDQFSRVSKALNEGEVELARKVMETHGNLGKRCEAEIDSIMDDPSLSIRDAVTLALTSRFLKRISAHLSNLASSVVNPFDRIGFRPGGDQPPIDAD